MGTGVLIPWVMCYRTLFLLYLYVLICSRICCKGEVCLPFQIPTYVYFNETSVSGSVIFVSNETKSLRNEWSVTSFEPRVALKFVKGTYQVVLLSAVDLDVANPDDICSTPEHFVQKITCYRNGQDPIVRWVTFQARPVNDIPPDAVTLPYIQISEGNISVPLFLHPLLHYFKDRDCPKERLMLSISNYSVEKKDARRYFTINSTTGYLYQIKPFDFEDKDIQCNLGKDGGFLNITAWDGLHKTSKPLKVTFINIDDAPPVFVNSVCSTVCFTYPLSSLTAIAYFTDQGPILTDPPAIKAIDLDTTQPNIIVYTLDVYPTKYKDIIQFENNRFVLLKSFENFSRNKDETDFTVEVNLQATGSNGQTSNRFVFTIFVINRPMISTSQQIYEQTSSIQSIHQSTKDTSSIQLINQSTKDTTSIHLIHQSTKDTSSIHLIHQSTKDTSSIQSIHQSTKDIVIIVLATTVALLLSVITVYTVYRIRMKMESKDNENNYEEVKQNNVTIEHAYATIHN